MSELLPLRTTERSPTGLSMDSVNDTCGVTTVAAFRQLTSNLLERSDSRCGLVMAATARVYYSRGQHAIQSTVPTYMKMPFSVGSHRHFSYLIWTVRLSSQI